jgi:cyclic pyranopterin phosphate synthase
MTLTALGVPAVPERSTGPAATTDAPGEGPLLDTYGRAATDLRVSLTDRCNLRCTYCMPADGLDWLPGEQLLRPDEMARLLRIAVTRLGVTRPPTVWVWLGGQPRWPRRA